MSITSAQSSSPLAGVVVTGASSDIGQAVCKHLVAKGIKTVGTYRSNLPTCSGLILPTRGLDLENNSDLVAFADFVIDQFDKPFGIVHCVGDFWDHYPIDQFTPESALKLIQSHYVSLYGVLHHLLPRMATLGGGRVLALSCTSIGFSYPEMAAFTAAKAAVESLIKCVANEWSDRMISANSLALSTIGTNKVMNSPSKPMSKEEPYITPSEIAELIEQIVFSPSPYLSGNVIRPLKHSPTFYNTAYFERNPPCSVE